jgi:hypothetical protein
MLAQLSSYQLSEWMAFSTLEPFGFDAEMMGHAITSSTIANFNRKKGSPTFKFQDFMPVEKKKPTAGEFFVNLKSLLRVNKKKQ